MVNFRPYDRNQQLLLPPDLREWVPEDDLAHFIIEAVERVGLGAFKVNWAGTGKAQYHPRLMLALLIYCYANGIFSSRRIERATHRDVAVRLVAADQHPDHDTIATFRRENAAAIAAAFAEVVVLARELGLLKRGMVSIDGSKIDANASKVRSLRYDRAQELRAQLDADIAELLARAEAADAEDTPDPRPCPRRSPAARRCGRSWTRPAPGWRRKRQSGRRRNGPPMKRRSANMRRATAKAAHPRSPTTRRRPRPRAT